MKLSSFLDIITLHTIPTSICSVRNKPFFNLWEWGRATVTTLGGRKHHHHYWQLITIIPIATTKDDNRTGLERVPPILFPFQNI